MVLLIDILEYLYNPSFTLREISRIIKKNGLLVIRTPNCANLKNRVLMLIGKSPYQNLEGWLFRDCTEAPSRSIFLGHFREYTMEEIKQMLKHYGFANTV